jgi:hypothetical protein
VCLAGTEFQLSKVTRDLEMDGSGSRTTMWKNLRLLNYMRKN